MGPATDSYETLKKLVKAGMNVARLNMSHGTHEEHKVRIDMLKKVRAEMSSPLAILLDSKGPEIRLKKFEKGSVNLKEGDKFTLTSEDCIGNEKRVSVTYTPLPSKVKAGDAVMINDGLVEFVVISVVGNDINCKVIHGGIISDKKGVNLPDSNVDMPYMSEADRNDFLFGIANDVDYFAISFCRNAYDVKIVKDLLVEKGANNIQIIAKIENREGVNKIGEILAVADGLMVARGDLGVEIPFEELPSVQKDMIKTCYSAGKKVITATQMLESMVSSPRPTRAEISDVANAIYDGTSAIMLSGETAIGKYPVEAVITMAKIAEKAESSIDYKHRFHTSSAEIKKISSAVSRSTVAASFDLDAKAIIAVSKSGETVRKISRFRPKCPIIGATTCSKAYNQLAMNWGVVPIMAQMQPNSDELFAHSIECAKKSGLVGKNDLVIIAAGVPVGASGNTNTMRIEVIK
ncbi:pyruvate kinase [Holotrichia oblita]|nr:pyruvate kinase [Holotrichia oblita]